MKHWKLSVAVTYLISWTFNTKPKPSYLNRHAEAAALINITRTVLLVGANSAGEKSL